MIDKRLTNCNTNVILIKAGSSIEMTDLQDYNETDLRTYQKLIKKLMYLIFGITPNGAFVVKQLGRHNANPKKEHFQAAK